MCLGDRPGTTAAFSTYDNHHNFFCGCELLQGWMQLVGVYCYSVSTSSLISKMQTDSCSQTLSGFILCTCFSGKLKAQSKHQGMETRRKVVNIMNNLYYNVPWICLSVVPSLQAAVLACLREISQTLHIYQLSFLSLMFPTHFWPSKKTQKCPKTE